MLDRMKEGLQNAVKRILGAAVLDEEAVKEFVRDVQRSLLQADVNVNIVMEASSKIEKRAMSETPPPGLSRKDHIVKILYEEISGLLGTEGNFDLPVDRTTLILMIGIQGSGKTTVSAKLARHLHRRGYRVGIICTDTFRPGALTQLRMLCEPFKIEVFGQEHNKDAAEIAGQGLEHFESLGKNVVIIDTAGRHKEEKGLLEEMQGISRRVSSDRAVLVVDGTIGQQCYSQAKAFHSTVPVGGIIITKLDGSARGGGALAAAAATGSRIFFIGTGERIDDLEQFSPTRFVGRLLGLGDINALLEHARELEDEADEKKLQRIMSGKMTIEDMYYQLEQVKKMGSLRKIMELIPGISSMVDTDKLEGLEDKMTLWKIIIQSMTKEEKTDPDILSSSRIRRISRGSGNMEKAVKEMMINYRQSKQVMKASKGRALKQIMKKLSAP